MKTEKDFIEIQKNKIIAQISYTIDDLDNNTFLGYIPSFDIPFTVNKSDSAENIARILIHSLLRKWLDKGSNTLLLKKLEKFNFSKSSCLDGRFEHKTSIKSHIIRQELDVV